MLPAGELPARRRLHAGREAAAGDAVTARAELLELLAAEVDVGILAAERAPDCGRLAPSDMHAVCVVERAGARRRC